MAQGFQYFYEDEVYRLSKKGSLQLGIVLENAEFVSSDDETDNEDDDDKVTKGNIRVAWHPKGEDEVLPEKKVGLADRSLMPGDVVRRMVKGKDTQRGYCRQVNVSSTIQVVGTKYVFPNVDSRGLTPLEEFTVGIAIALDSWVGMVNMSKCRIVLNTIDGSQCTLCDQEAFKLDDVMDIEDSINFESEYHCCNFYPGQKLIGQAKVFTKAEWSLKTKEMEAILAKPNKYIRSTVDKVIVDQLGVKWQCRAFSNDFNPDKEQPKCNIQGDDLNRVRMLNVFEPCTLQLGDRNYYVLKDTDSIIITKEQWKKRTASQLLSDNNNPLKPRSLKNKKSRNLYGDNDKTTNHNVSTNIEARIDNDDSSDDYVDESDDFDTTSISSGASTGSQGRKNKRGHTLATKVLRKRRFKKTKRRRYEEKPGPVHMPGEKVVVKTLMTTSKADVVWQDGSVEDAIPSTALYPIHHLDDQEFFPGDFVVEQRHAVDTHEYGVVQRVDHAGRTAIVKWFHTYTAGSDPRPQFRCEQEVSVYDLRDHPDFRYRPGSVVIRVANFENDQKSYIGQVLDNFPTGEVSVWWVDGKSSVCYPQDLYKVGEYDSDEGELWEESTSEESWETESEHSVIEDVESENGSHIKSKLLANIEKARISTSRLEEMFNQNHTIQTTAVMKQLLDLYKECRFCDKLMGTNFFCEDNFLGLIEMIREKCRASSNQKMAEQFNRLFTASCDGEVIISKVGNCDVLKEHCEVDSLEAENNKESHVKNSNECLNNIKNKEILNSSVTLCENLVNLALSSPVKPKPESRFRHHEPIRNKRMSETDMLNNEKSHIESLPRDSKSCNDLKSGIGGAAANHPMHNDDFTASHMCAKLCGMMKTQLLKTYEQVVSRYGGHFDMSLMQGCQDGDTLVSNDEPIDSQKDDKDTKVEKDDVSRKPVNGMIKSACGNTVTECTEDVNLETSLSLETCVEQSPDGFQVLEAAPDCHKFKLTMFQPNEPSNFYRTVSREMSLLKTSLPSGIWVRGYEDRMDLYSVMIEGPERTPYEDGFMFFDFQLSADYPRAPPLCHYISYCSDKMNPNLYEDGKVCISLLGTWSGKGTEIWTSQSNLLQLIVSIQGLILVSEPYFNEAGFERQKGTQQGRENSRMYNEMVILKLVQSMAKIIQNPPEIFKEEIINHFKQRAGSLVSRLDRWLQISEKYNSSHPLSPTTPNTYRDISDFGKEILPEYPLIPASKGFCLTLLKTLESFKSILQGLGIKLEPESGAESSSTILTKNLTEDICSKVADNISSVTDNIPTNAKETFPSTT